MRRLPALAALVALLALLEGCGGSGPAPAEVRRTLGEAPVGAVADGGSEPARGMSPVERAQREQERLATGIQRGWTESQVIAFAGEPRSREGGVWAWHFGLADGPRYDVLVTLRAGKVVEVQTAAAACILRE